jgi:hypothetical protein
MAQPTGRSTRSERLVAMLFDDIGPDPLAQELRDWTSSSTRFRAFVEDHRDKVRKKLRGAADPDARRDVRAELRVAHLLLQDRHVELAFEAYGAARGGPDFTVSYRGGPGFNLEVTRLRGAPGPDGLRRTLLTKLRQLPPSAPNALLVEIEGDRAAVLDVSEVSRSLRLTADAKDEGFFSARGIDGTRGFYDRYLRLGAVLVLCEGGTGEARASLWHNRSARIPVPERASRACLRGLQAIG